eukprot:8128626-Pyramimonas_sp.AAC.2
MQNTPRRAFAPRGYLCGAYNRKVTMFAWKPKGTLGGGRSEFQVNMVQGFACHYGPRPYANAMAGNAEAPRAHARAPRWGPCGVHNRKAAMLVWGLTCALGNDISDFQVGMGSCSAQCRTAPPRARRAEFSALCHNGKVDMLAWKPKCGHGRDRSDVHVDR